MCLNVLNDPLQSMEARGNAGWFSCGKEKEGAQEFARRRCILCTVRVQATCWLERTLYSLERTSFYLKGAKPEGYPFERTMMWAQANKLLDGAARANVVQARANKFLKGSARAGCWPLERTWSHFWTWHMKKKSRFLERILWGWKPEYAKRLLV